MTIQERHRMADMLAVLGNPTCLRVLSCLREGELSTHQMIAATGLARELVCKYAKRLQRVGLVQRRRHGVFYTRQEPRKLHELAAAGCRFIQDVTPVAVPE